MQYLEYAPRRALAAVVDRLWTLEGDARDLAVDDQPVLPDGRCEAIVQFADPFARVGADGVELQPDIVYAGQLEGPLVLRPIGRIAVLGVRFHSDGAAALTRVPQRLLAGVIQPVDAIDARLGRALDQARERAATLADGVRLVQDGLEHLIEPDRLDRRVGAVVRRLRARPGQVGIDRLAEEVGMTRRHLERRFQEVVGLSPKRLARISRFQFARRVLERVESRQRGTATAAMCGYADQAHFIREFRALAGCAPEAHLRRGAELTEFFADGGRDC